MNAFPQKLICFTTSCALVVAFAAQTASGQATLLLTITNPTPATSDKFGGSVAVFGSDRVIIGTSGAAANTGEAYLYNTNGTLLTTFTNPTPATEEYFGQSVAAVGNSVLIGAPFDNTGATGAGAAYLFNTNGSLLRTLTNPSPADYDVFGVSVSAVGNDRVLIGASLDDISAADGGATYLFGTNGILLATFTNPPPVFGNERFGRCVAVVGNDRVLIGAVGKVHLFSTNGTLLQTIANPQPTFNDFGGAVAAVGSDRMLVGAIFDPTGASDAGAAFLFNTNGTLLLTYTNPTPTASEHFGSSVAGAGSDRVLIGAEFENTGASTSGSAYLFSTNGALLATITNPAPASSAYFGRSVAALGNDRAIIGADGDDRGAFDAGAVHLFSLPGLPPLLAIRLTTTNAVLVSWPSPSLNFTLQQNTNSIGSLNWSNIVTGIQDDGTNKYIIVNPPAGNRFYRLLKP